MYKIKNFIIILKNTWSTRTLLDRAGFCLKTVFSLIVTTISATFLLGISKSMQTMLIRLH